MKNDTGPKEARQQYAAAQAAPYETKDLHEALGLYKRIVVAHPDAKEAGYSRSQIQNMAMAHLGGDRQQEREIPVAPALEARA